MITVKMAVENIHRKYPNLLIEEGIQLDNGYFFFAKERGSDKPKLGAAGLYVDPNSGVPEFAPLSFLAQHDTLDGKPLDISRFQTPEEVRTRNNSGGN